MISARRAIVRAATIIMLGNVASRLLGLVREQVIAALFGASGMTDAFVAASTVPTIVTAQGVLAGGEPRVSESAEASADPSAPA